MSILDRFRENLPKKKTREELDEHYARMDKVKLEKGDLPAMIIAAFITFFPILIIAMVIFFGLLWLFLIR